MAHNQNGAETAKKADAQAASCGVSSIK